jgi:molybdate transport system substrate-binding protein
VRVRILLTILLALLLVTPGAATAAISCETGSHVATPMATPEEITPYPSFPENGGEIRIMAAASLTDAFGEMESLLEERYSGLEITIETAGSQTLVAQLQQGAEADILATADTITMQSAVESSLVEGEPVAFAANRLVIAAPEGNPAGIASLDDLAGDVTLVLPGAEVPAGAYGRTALCAHAATTDEADAWLEKVDANIVSEEPDVRHVVTKLILGEADAGIIYASDAVAVERAGTPLTIIELPDDTSPRATYPIAPVTDGNANLAHAFIGFLLSDEGQAILQDYGFAN